MKVNYGKTEIDALIEKTVASQKARGATNIRVDRGAEGMHLSYDMEVDGIPLPCAVYALYKDFL